MLDLIQSYSEDIYRLILEECNFFHLNHLRNSSKKFHNCPILEQVMESKEGRPGKFLKQIVGLRAFNERKRKLLHWGWERWREQTDTIPYHIQGWIHVQSDANGLLTVPLMVVVSDAPIFTTYSFKIIHVRDAPAPVLFHFKDAPSQCIPIPNSTKPLRLFSIPLPTKTTNTFMFESTCPFTIHILVETYVPPSDDNPLNTLTGDAQFFWVLDTYPAIRDKQSISVFKDSTFLNWQLAYR